MTQAARAVGTEAGEPSGITVAPLDADVVRSSCHPTRVLVLRDLESELRRARLRAAVGTARPVLAQRVTRANPSGAGC